MDDRLQDCRTATVFGATGGIGRALVCALAADGWRVVAGSRTGAMVEGSADAFAFDLTDEQSIAEAARTLANEPIQIAIVATGALTLPSGHAPEKSLRQVDPTAMAQAFVLNVTGPALIAKHFVPLLPRNGRGVFAVLGARVGSIGDNRLGGWHAYRASKAALVMLVKTIAVEAARTHPEAVIAALHPGTIDTSLSAPFQRNLAAGQLIDPATAAKHLLEVIDRLTVSESGGHFDWRGEAIAP